MVTDNTTTGRQNQKEIQRVSALIDNENLVIELLDDLSIDALGKRLRGLDGQSREIMRRGCNGFLQKPFNAAVLSQKIRQVLNAVTGG